MSLVCQVRQQPVCSPSYCKCCLLSQLHWMLGLRALETVLMVLACRDCMMPHIAVCTPACTPTCIALYSNMQHKSAAIDNISADNLLYTLAFVSLSSVGISSGTAYCSVRLSGHISIDAPACLSPTHTLKAS